MGRRWRRSILALLVAGALTTIVAGCSSASTSSLAQDYQKTAGKGYIAGDGSILTIPAGKRKPAPQWTSKDDTGTTWSTAKLRGSVVVLNFWYASCPPCRAEAPDLRKLSAELTPKGVVFLGVNVRDEMVTSRGFAKTYGLTYPSLLDEKENTLQLAYAGETPANAVPTTLILDRQGRVAARFSGRIMSVVTFTDIVNGVLAEKS
ncbi:MAG: TlpA family protein disulfide reductase [Micrococcales bacterium]|nr:TlpA family protein disulfide reductase [Micrococcales bacterium]